MFKWTTKEGKELKLSEIGDNHLLNILKMLRKQKEVEVSGDYCGCFDPDSMAFFLADSDDEWYDQNEETLKIINKEVKKRGLKSNRREVLDVPNK